jgi:hypothetical protein
VGLKELSIAFISAGPEHGVFKGVGATTAAAAATFVFHKGAENSDIIIPYNTTVGAARERAHTH